MPISSAHADNASSERRARLNGIGLAAAPATQRLITALDFPDARAALDLVDRLQGIIHWLKIGPELYLNSGNALVEELHRRGFSIFLDLKFHDIPNTVQAAVRAAAKLGVEMLTVHATGGRAMLAAAAEAAAERTNGPAVLAVTVLTSMDDSGLEATGVRGGVSRQVESLAALAVSCGVNGLVCSAQEASGLRERVGGEPLLVVPGIRPAGTSDDDQRRVATPEAAMLAGASYLVVGRPICRAADPAAAAGAILAQMESARMSTAAS